MLGKLDLVPTDDLILELVKRHDALAITGVKYTKANGEYLALRRYKGCRVTCLGMLDVLKQLIINDEFKMTIPIDKDEDR